MADSKSGTIAVLAEKPSVARDIAQELGATSRGDGYLHGNRYVVTWAVGHLVSLAQPHEINAEWRHWRRDLLPILPKHWPLVVYEKTKDQFEVVERILNSPRVSRVAGSQNSNAARVAKMIRFPSGVTVKQPSCSCTPAPNLFRGSNVSVHAGMFDWLRRRISRTSSGAFARSYPRAVHLPPVFAWTIKRRPAGGRREPSSGSFANNSSSRFRSAGETVRVLFSAT